MEIHYCEHFDNEVFLNIDSSQVGVLYAGDGRLLDWLETQLGLQLPQHNTDYLRIELYRQSLMEYRQQQTEMAFYSDSFEADPWATAETLLAWRDELLLAGWNFTILDDCPLRLRTLVCVEGLFRQKIDAFHLEAPALGVPDRYERVLGWLTRRRLPLRCVYLYEPISLLRSHIRRLLVILQQQGVRVETCTIGAPLAPEGSDLAHWQAHLCGMRVERRPAQADGSLLVYRIRRDSDAALFLAQHVAHSTFRPLLLMSEGGFLEQALRQQGQPSLGFPQSSLARPSLQTLKLASAFLWEPIDAFKVMEFLTLPLKPFDDGLAVEIARVLADRPGLFSETWFAAVNSYLEKSPTSTVARKHYEFWFARRRYPNEGTAPSEEAAEIFDYLYRWAIEHSNTASPSNLLVLAEQARRVRDVLRVQPNARISKLELERIVRTIHEPAPLALHSAQVGGLAYVRQAGALAQPTEVLCWWNCANDMLAPAVDQWQPEERLWLQKHTVRLQTSQENTRRHLFFLAQPILKTKQQLIIFMPEQIGGYEAQPSLLLSDLESIFREPDQLLVDLNTAQKGEKGEAFEQVETILPLSTGKVGTHLQVSAPEHLGEVVCETPTELEQMLYFPHRWFFRRKMHLYPGSLLSIARDQQLLGKLAHRFFEMLLREDECLHWDRKSVFQWVEQKAAGLLAKEGATLLLYGREPERHYLVSRVKTAAWSLLECIRADQWQIYGTEVELEGMFCNVPLRGRADLVLQRSGNEWAIVDLKWSGLRRRKELMSNEEDLQLVLYSYLLPPAGYWAHTAFFIIEEARMIARNKQAFRHAVLAHGRSSDHVEVCRRVFDKMEKTFLWRQSQLQQGQIELRYVSNAEALEKWYSETDMRDLLEMKRDDGYRDDYHALLWGGE